MGRGLTVWEMRMQVISSKDAEMEDLRKRLAAAEKQLAEDQKVIALGGVCKRGSEGLWLIYEKGKAGGAGGLTVQGDGDAGDCKQGHRDRGPQKAAG